MTWRSTWAQAAPPGSGAYVPAPVLFPLPQTPSEMIRQAIGATRRALDAGVLRQKLELLLPVNGRRRDFLSTEDLFSDEPALDVYSTGGACAGLILEGLLPAAEPIKSYRIDEFGVDDEPVGVFFPEKSRSPLAALFPTSDSLEHLRRLADKRERPLLLLNPQWNTRGQVVSDFGIGPWRRSAEDFLATFAPTYSLLELRVGAGRVAQRFGFQGGVIRLLQCYPGRWQVFVLATDGASELVACERLRPTYKRLEEILGEYRPEPSRRVPRRRTRTVDDGAAVAPAQGPPGLQLAPAGGGGPVGATSADAAVVARGDDVRLAASPAPPLESAATATPAKRKSQTSKAKARARVDQAARQVSEP